MVETWEIVRDFLCKVLFLGNEGILDKSEQDKLAKTMLVVEAPFEGSRHTHTHTHTQSTVVTPLVHAHRSLIKQPHLLHVIPKHNCILSPSFN